MKKRDEAVDIVKGFAILAIVFYHIAFTPFNDSVRALTGGFWKVPIFFLIAGFFLKNEKVTNPIKFIFGLKKLYLKTTIIYLISILLHNLFVRINWYPEGTTQAVTGIEYYLYDFSEIFIRCLKTVFCAGHGETIMGAMWFAYVLIMALVGYSIVSYMVNLFFDESSDSYNIVRLIVLLLAAGVSYVATHIYGFTIPRVNNTLTAMCLIGFGRITFLYGSKYFNNYWVILLSFVLMLDCIFRTGCTRLNQNEYLDLPTLIIGTISSYFVLQFIGRKIVNTYIGNLISLCGRNSYYIMAYHILGFMICSEVLKMLNIFNNTSPRGMYTFLVENNILYISLYFIFGVGVSLLLLQCGKIIKRVWNKIC